MPAYVLLSRLSSDSYRKLSEDPVYANGMRETLERWEANIISEHFTLGPYDHCTVFEVSDNFRAHRAALQQELSDAGETYLFPVIDAKLFERLVRTEIRTEGPHRWQVSWWARSARFCFRWYQYSRWIWKYCKPLTVTGREHFAGLKGPCIVVGNHTSHLDAMVLFHCLPQRIKSNIYFGAAADRWFLRKGGGKSALALQPWYNSLIGGSFPITRGGGSKTLDYSKWLLDQGANLGIFPEGTRSTSRNMSRFKHGVSILALEKNVPVVPIYLSGLAKLRPKGSREVTPGPAGAHIQPAIHFDPGTTVPEATQMIYDALNTVHRRVHEYGDDAARYDFEPPVSPAPAEVSRPATVD